MQVASQWAWRRVVSCAGVVMIALVTVAMTRTVSARATALEVGSSRVSYDAATATLRVTTTVAWKNAWRNARNHDAVWLFVKMRGAPTGNWNHVRLARIVPAGGSPALTCEVANDRVGGFCSPASTHRGDITGSVTIEIDTAGIPPAARSAPTLEARTFGIEMVYVPAGPVSIGDPDPRSATFAAFYRSNASGGHAGTYRITSEAEIRVGPQEGALYYTTQYPQYEGDRAGPIPAAFPKGTRAFYAMKYEVLQGQYAAFLNTIGYEATHFRAIHGGVGYAEERGSIRLDGRQYVAQHPNRPTNWMSWDDGLAFSDWAGLRPMTEFEFTKAARGSVEPGAAQFPWGTASRERLLRRVGPDDDLVQTGAADESRLTDETRDVLGASYYWVMDLAGSVWERVVTPGHARGRAFRGTHGDGRLGSYGIATNTDWPSGDHESGGYGYRGGGYYERERERGQPDRDFNPFSPVEWRRYGSWGGAPRSVGYGYRAVRTADR